MGEPWLTGPLGPSAGVCQRNPQVCGPGRCLPRPSGYTCACDSGFRLSPQGTHCVGEPSKGGGRGRGGGLCQSPPDQPILTLRCGRMPPHATALCPRAL